MTGPSLTTLEALADQIGSQLGNGERCLVGVTGSPGVGKSTFVAELAARFAPTPPVVGMDAFHLAHRHLEAVGLVHRKGAHYTFDAWGYVATLRRIVDQSTDEVVYAPEFDRAIEDSIAAMTPVTLADRLILTEGNYLLIDLPPWNQVKDLLTTSIYLEVDEEIRLDRLVRRHVEFGKTPDHAVRHVHESDEVNARLIEESRPNADFVVRL